MERRKTSTKEAGHALLELAMVLPILCLIGFGGLELARSLRFAQIASMLSRETASIAFRECAAETETLAATDCLDLVRTRLTADVNDVATGGELVISLYRYDPAGGTYSLVAESRGGTRTSKFGLLPGGAGVSGNLNNAVFQFHRTIVIGEIYLPYQSLVGAAGGLFSYSPDFFYDATVL